LKTPEVVSFSSEELVLVDSNDRECGFASKADAHMGEGRLHRAFSVFLFNKDGELLIQQRSAQKRLWPGFWSNTCCSHPRVGETLDVATRRRLDDELNLSAELEFVYRFVYQARYGEAGSEHELCHVFLGRFDGGVKFNTSEISGIRYLPVAAVADELDRVPESFTPWFKMEWQELLEKHADVLARYAG